jgi:hypothetical protein
LIDRGVTVSRLRVKPTESYYPWGSEKNIRVLEDRIEFIKNDEKASYLFKMIINTVKYGDYYGRISVYFGDFHITVKGKEAGQKVKKEFESLIEKNR